MKKINVKNLVLGNLGDNQTELVEEVIESLDLPDEAKGKEVFGKLKLTRLDETILLQGHLKAGLEIVCDRCLEHFPINLDIDFDREYEIDRSNQTPESLYVDKYNDIDVSEPIREEIILAIPMRKICEENCKGLCSECGGNLNKNRCKCK